MSNIEQQWWNEEIKDMYKLIIFYSYILSSVSVFPRILYSAYILSSDLAFYTLILTSTHLACFCLIKYFENKSALSKSIIAVLFLEFYTLSCYIPSMKNREHICLRWIFSLVTTIQFQLPMVKNKVIFNLLLIKHILMWYYLSVDIEVLKKSYDITPVVAAAAVIIVCNIGNYYRLKISYERFVFSKEVEASKNRFEIITQAFTDGIIVITVNQKVEFYNSTALEFLNCRYHEIFSELMKCKYCAEKKISQFNHSDMLIDDLNYIFENAQVGEVTLGVIQINNINLEWKAKNIIWERNQAIFLTIRNINQIIELEKSIANDHMKTVLLRSVSHELKTPLNAIAFFTDELIEKPLIEMPDSEKEKLKLVLISSKLMLSLINDLLDYSKMLAGAFTINKTSSDIRQAIYNACDLISMQAKKKNISLIYRVDPNIPELVFTDIVRFSQILLNLLSNALKFTIKGYIEICVWINSENKLECKVEDTGIGINKEIKRKLFTEFSTNYNPVLNSQGSGLGLWISNFLVKSLGGSGIKAKSKLGKGSSFLFAIDIYEDTPEIRSYEESLANIDEAASKSDFYFDRNFNNVLNSKVLIVDDNELNRMILASILSQNNISYAEAWNGKDALNKIIECNNKGSMYSIVIMDCNMPEMDGFEATREIVKLYLMKKLYRLPNIIGYSAYSSDEDRNACFECGMVDYLPKPSPSEKIINLIKQYL
ncbi:unnamed protein product [Blepharisma stoltei]|uniref:Histidine kinase n=1 Tax=Blepharisma stoltei TaxID=1481888 RepID=A0AAU9J4Q5_9CILI|nr:unnamed protein product [Blepharisma stoltei]